MSSLSKKLAIILSVFILSPFVAGLWAGEAEESLPPPDRSELELAERIKCCGPAGKRHILATLACKDGDGVRLFTLQTLDLWLITTNYDGLLSDRAPRVTGNTAYMLIESDTEDPTQGRLRWLQYGGRPRPGSLMCDLVYDPEGKSVYIVKHQQLPYGALLSVDRADVAGQGAKIPEFDPSKRDKWPVPSSSAVGGILRLYPEISADRIAAVYERDYLLVCSTGSIGVGERSSFYRLDLKTQRWFELAITMKEQAKVIPRLPDGRQQPTR